MDLDGYIRAINAHDWDGIVSYYTDDVIYEDITLGERHQGRESVRTFWQSAAADFSSDFRIEVMRSFGTGTDYAMEWVFKGTHDGSNPQLGATGKQFAVRGFTLGRLEGDRIKENKDVWNMAEFLSQVGLMPAHA